jgi:transposase InsO family protein
MEQRYQAVLAVQVDGLTVTEVADKLGVARQTVHRWLRRYEAGGMEGLADRSHRPASCPHQIPAAIEVRVCELRRRNPFWGPVRIAHQLRREGIDPSPSHMAIWRALVRHGLIDATARRKVLPKFRRWERARPMELWQLDVVGGVLLADGTTAKILTGVDDHSRFCVCAGLMARATARPVCGHFAEALRTHGVPEEVLTDNGKVFTDRFGRQAEVLFDRICRENGIAHRLTAPHSPTTTGKIERFHRTLRTEFLAGRVFEDLLGAQAALDAWVGDYNTLRPHQGIGMATPAERFGAQRDRPGPTLDAHLVALDENRNPEDWVTRKVSTNGVIAVSWQQISVGRHREGRRVDVHVLPEILEIWDGNELLKTVKRDSRGVVRKKRAQTD